jgi:hypothetical protein
MNFYVDADDALIGVRVACSGVGVRGLQCLPGPRTVRPSEIAGDRSASTYCVIFLLTYNLRMQRIFAT